MIKIKIIILVIKKKRYYCNKQQTDTSKMIKYIFGVTNTEMRHSNETYNNNTGDIDVITTGYKINAHSSATAHDFYTEKNTTVKKKKK